jgi:transposase-like protein
MAQQKHPSSRRYPPEVKERAVQLVLTTMKQQGERHGVVTRIARQLDIGPETLRNWVRQAEVDNGDRPGLTTDDHELLPLTRAMRSTSLSSVRRHDRQRKQSTGWVTEYTESAGIQPAVRE